jgi:hypothetical protein
MQLAPKNSRTWNIFAFSILALGIAVFAWGLKYKLSLYESATPPAHHVMVAKLLSDRERSADTAVQIERATTPFHTVLFTALALLARFQLDRQRQSRWTLQCVINPQRRRVPQTALQIFFRPPPPPSK